MKKVRFIMWNFFELVFALLGRKYATGNITLVINGERNVKIHTGFHPTDVWINPKCPEGLPVCGAGGDMDCFDVTKTHDGFILHVNLATEMREVEWVATR